MSINKKVGLFGLGIHAIIVAAFLVSRTVKGEHFGTELLFVGIPLLLVSAYLTYSVVVTRYLKRRSGMQKAVIIDSLVGMLVEYIIFTVAGILFGIVDGFRTAKEGALLGGLMTGVFMNILWVYATFMVQILILGNLCGLVGWLVLKKTRIAQ